MSSKTNKTPLLLADGGQSAKYLFDEEGLENKVEECNGDNRATSDPPTQDDDSKDKAPVSEDVQQRSNLETDTSEKSFFVILLTFLATTGSFLFGYDTGVVSGAMLFLREEFELTYIEQEIVVSVTIGAAALFALVGAVLTDKLGRKPTIIIASVMFSIGAAVLGFAVNLAMLIIGRTIVGIGIGLSSMTIPVYVAECAPASIRGSLVTLLQLMITTGMLVSNLLAGAFSYMDGGWRYMLGLACVPSILQLLGFVYMPESPRWLVKNGMLGRAEEVLVKLRGTTKVSEELAAIQETCQQNPNGKVKKRFGILFHMLTSRSIRRALVIGCGLQMFQQFSGINTVMYYTATVFKMAGVSDNSLAIWLSCAVAGCNFLATFIALRFIDRIGRKPLVVGSFIGVFISLVVLAVGFQLAAENSPQVTFSEANTTCSIFSTCEACTGSVDCGFCYVDQNGRVNNSSCVHSAGKYSEYSAVGRCSQSELHNHTATWAYDFCPSDKSWIALLGLLMYIVSFAPGLGPIPWTVNSEIYPLWARSTGNGLSTATNWTFNLLISMTFLSLTAAITKYGTYWLYSGLAFLGIVFVTLLVPETKGRSLEEMEQILQQSWIVFGQK